MATTSEKQVMVVGIDDREQSRYCLRWAIDHFFAPFAGNSPLKLVLVHAKPSAASAIGYAGLGAAHVLPFLEADLKDIAASVIDAAQRICSDNKVTDVLAEVVEGDPRNVLCEAVEKHNASMLVVGNRKYGAIKSYGPYALITRSVLGSVGDYCAHHADCSVMIVKKPKN